MPNRSPANLGSTAWFLQLSGTLLLFTVLPVLSR